MIKTLSGTNEFMIGNELKNIISLFEKNYGKMAIEQIDGSEIDLQTLVETLTNLSFLSPNRLIVLKRGSANKQFTEKFEDIVNDVPSTNEVVILEPNIDKRIVYYKNLKKLTDFTSYDELEFGDLARWIVKTVEDSGGSIVSGDARYLVEIAGLNQMKLASEITKLLNYQKKINKESIDLLVEPLSQTTIFQLLDAAFAGDNKKILKIYDDQKMQKVEPQQIIAMLTWQVHVLSVIKAAGNKSSSEIAGKAKISPFVINKSIGISNRMNKQDIQKLTSNLLELDIKLKNKTIDADEALLQLLLSINK